MHYPPPHKYMVIFPLCQVDILQISANISASADSRIVQRILPF